MLSEAANSSRLPSSSRNLSTAGSALQADPLVNTSFPGGTDPNHIFSPSYGPSPSQIRSGDEKIRNGPPRELTPPDNQLDHIAFRDIRRTRAYDRPGKKPAALYRRDPLELQRHCKQRGGSSFSVNWIMVAFKHGVSLDALVRPLDFTEVEVADRSSNHGFELRQAYDGFLAKIGHQFECGLCKEDKRAHWVHKKDAIRHLRKFHFGLADRCGMWCVLISLGSRPLRTLIRFASLLRQS